MFSVAYVTGKIFDHVYRKRWSALYFEKSDALIKDTTAYDVIFIGNSRVHFGINPYYVDSVLRLNTYNFGNGGADAEDMALTASVYLQKHRAPKLTVISLDKGILTKSEILKTRFYYLFYLQNDTINKYMRRAGLLTPLIKVLPFTKYSFFDEYNRTSLFVKGKQYPVFNHNIYKGFLNIHRNRNAAALYNMKEGNGRVWDTAVNYLRNIITMMQAKGSVVVFVSPPEKNAAQHKETALVKFTDSIFTALANEYHLQHFHFENDLLFTDDYFTDEIHLNEPGTRVYSIQLADCIKSILTKQNSRP
jgi:hypothetical protein